MTTLTGKEENHGRLTSLKLKSAICLRAIFERWLHKCIIFVLNCQAFLQELCFWPGWFNRAQIYPPNVTQTNRRSQDHAFKDYIIPEEKGTNKQVLQLVLHYKFKWSSGRHVPDTCCSENHQGGMQTVLQKDQRHAAFRTCHINLPKTNVKPGSYNCWERNTASTTQSPILMD